MLRRWCGVFSCVVLGVLCRFVSIIRYVLIFSRGSIVFGGVGR